jgi:hypothetical protein
VAQFDEFDLSSSNIKSLMQDKKWQIHMICKEDCTMCGFQLLTHIYLHRFTLTEETPTKINHGVLVNPSNQLCIWSTHHLCWVKKFNDQPQACLFNFHVEIVARFIPIMHISLGQTIQNNYCCKINAQFFLWMEFGKPSALLNTLDIIAWKIFSEACTNLKDRTIKPP